MQASETNKQLVNSDIIKDLEDAVLGGVRRNVLMRDLSWYKIGGNADVVVEPDSTLSAAAVMRCLKKHNALFTVIGTASNILFDDAGYRGVLIKIADNNFNKLSFEDGGIVRAGAGLWVPHYVRNIIQLGLEGCVHAIGIPGALGGLIIMNGGSQRKGIGDQLVDVTIVDKDGEVRVLKQAECEFGYRSSALQRMGCIVTGATFRYARGDKGKLHNEALNLLVERGKKFPRKLPSCGSVFLSYPEMYEIIGPPGKAIEDLGFKGKIRGGAQISPLHANFIVNTGDAKAMDVLFLIHECRSAIMKKSGFDLKCEVRFLPSDGELRQAHLQADKLYRDL